MRNQGFKLCLGGGRFILDPGRLGQRRVMLAPFIRRQDHRLCQIERAEFGVDRHRDDGPRQRQILGIQSGAFGAEHQRCAALFAHPFARGGLRGHDGLGHPALAHRGGVNMRAIGHRLGHRVEQPRLFQHDVRPAGSRAGGGIGPAVTRRDQPHIGHAEIQHGPRRLADIFTQLRANENDGGRGRLGHGRCGCRWIGHARAMQR